LHFVALSLSSPYVHDARSQEPKIYTYTPISSILCMTSC